MSITPGTVALLLVAAYLAIVVIFIAGIWQVAS